ncbi:MAG TPA: helix-turn-helix transcriptional regulator [Rhodanobacteraceae bacterium]|nr:helix-turn-helix transcriptional regulator [Rhodanobacteraceae bacterium]
MTRSLPSLLPRLERSLRGLGTRIRQARLRRAYTAATVSQRAGVSRATLLRVERGDAAVALGIYARVLQALGLDADLERLAADDVLGRKLQDAGLGERARAPRRRRSAAPP